MNTKQFTTLQLFSLADGRLSTNMDDVYEMLNHITGESLMTHHLPTAMDYLRHINPGWFQNIRKEIKNIETENKDLLMPLDEKGRCDFKKTIEVLKQNNKAWDIPQLEGEDKANFGKYLCDNSLLIKWAEKKAKEANNA